MSPKAQRFKICQVDVLNPLGTWRANGKKWDHQR